MKIFFNEKFRVILISMLMVALGIVFCVVPEKSMNAIELIIAVGLVLVGMVYIFGFCFAPDFAKEARILLIGLLATALGILVIFVPSALVLGIGIIYGYAGLSRIGLSIDEKLAGDRSWWIEFASGIIVFALSLSLIILRSTSIAASIVMIYMGSCLIAMGVFNLVLVFALKRGTERIKKMIKESLKTQILRESEMNADSDNDGSNPDNFTDFEVK